MIFNIFAVFPTNNFGIKTTECMEDVIVVQLQARETVAKSPMALNSSSDDSLLAALVLKIN